MPRINPVSWLLLGVAVFFLLPLGFHGLWTPDETRYAQVSQEMLMSGAVTGWRRTSWACVISRSPPPAIG